MAFELRILGLVLALALVQILLTAHFRTRQYGVAWNVGARDAAMPPLAPLAGRLARAQANLFETLPLFVGAVLAVVLAHGTGLASRAGVLLYLGGRIAYVPLYALGVPVVRTIAWGVATLGLVLLLWPLLAG